MAPRSRSKSKTGGKKKPSKNPTKKQPSKEKPSKKPTKKPSKNPTKKPTKKPSKGGSKEGSKKGTKEGTNKKGTKDGSKKGSKPPTKRSKEGSKEGSKKGNKSKIGSKKLPKKQENVLKKAATGPAGGAIFAGGGQKAGERDSKGRYTVKQDKPGGNEKEKNKTTPGLEHACCAIVGIFLLFAIVALLLFFLMYRGDEIPVGRKFKSYCGLRRQWNPERPGNAPMRRSLPRDKQGRVKSRGLENGSQASSVGRGVSGIGDSSRDPEIITSGAEKFDNDDEDSSSTSKHATKSKVDSRLFGDEDDDDDGLIPPFERKSSKSTVRIEYAPWVVAIKGKNGIWGTGVIVGNNWILTAAQNVDEGDSCKEKCFVYYGAGGIQFSKTNKSEIVNCMKNREQPIALCRTVSDSSRLDHLHLNAPRISGTVKGTGTAWPICTPDEETGGYNPHDMCEIVAWEAPFDGDKQVTKPQMLTGTGQALPGALKGKRIKVEWPYCGGHAGAPLVCAKKMGGEEHMVLYGILIRSDEDDMKKCDQGAEFVDITTIAKWIKTQVGDIDSELEEGG